MTTVEATSERYTYDLPAALEASEPPEARGLTRDAVRMLVAYRSSGVLVPSSFVFLPRFLEPGDLLVINTSGTIPAAVDGVDDDGNALVVHLSTQLDDTRWVVEPRRVVGRTTERWVGPPPSRRLRLPDGALLTLEKPYGEKQRLWVATLELPQRTLSWLADTAALFVTAMSRGPGPSRCTRTSMPPIREAPRCPVPGGRSLRKSSRVLVAKGVGITPLVLHTGVASLEADELPYPERVTVPMSTAERVNAAHRSGGRVIAVGTTVVRALETSVGDDGNAHAYDGWTDLVISPERGVRVIDGMVTGWHEPASSHLMMLEAIAGRELVRDSYEAALAGGYLWHEFGDVHLILP